MNTKQLRIFSRHVIKLISHILIMIRSNCVALCLMLGLLQPVRRLSYLGKSYSVLNLKLVLSFRCGCLVNRILLLFCDK